MNGGAITEKQRAYFHALEQQLGDAETVRAVIWHHTRGYALNGASQWNVNKTLKLIIDGYPPKWLAAARSAVQEQEYSDVQR